mgnify:CR=1 FL=1
MKHNPFPYNPVADQATYDNKMRIWLADMIILMAIIIVGLEKHPMVKGEVGSSKIKKDWE